MITKTKAGIYFVRHGNAGPAKTDFLRNLSQKGIEQVDAAGKLLEHLENPLFISSDAPRAIDTARIIQRGKKFEVVPMHALYEHHDPRVVADCEELWKQLSYGSLEDYLRLEKGAALDTFGHAAAEAVLEILGARFERDVVFVGHAATNNAFGKHLFEFSDEISDLMMTHKFGEAGIVEIIVDIESQDVDSTRVLC